MRRDTFLRSLAALAACGALPLPARAAAANMKMMIPANPGGGWDTTGRALGKALQDAGVAASVSYDNKGGAAGAIGLAQFVNAQQGRRQRADDDGRGDGRRHHHQQAAGAAAAGHAGGAAAERVQGVRAAGRTRR